MDLKDMVHKNMSVMEFLDKIYDLKGRYWTATGFEPTKLKLSDECSTLFKRHIHNITGKTDFSDVVKCFGMDIIYDAIPTGIHVG